VIDYTIKAIPTTYRGRRYRSRLEARWAAFFDEMGWEYEYEPCDLGRWSPDFSLLGARPSYPVMVEVKPIDDWHRETARKMSDACEERSISHFLLVGKTPQPLLGVHGTMIGWLGQLRSYEADWTEAVLLQRGDRFDFVGDDADRFCQETLIWEFQESCQRANPSDAWIRAANAVQWKPPA